MKSMPLSWRIAAVGIIIGAWACSHVAEYRAQAWANAPAENWTSDYKATVSQLNDLHARERLLHAEDGLQQQRDKVVTDYRAALKLDPDDKMMQHGRAAP